ncbi:MULTISPECIES: hypothetical protein [Allobacillus]|uniref:Uncharacterized protein n=1 Tax=Allobacillus halotolerans TaxID=570278 RepID=A0ABS6GR08_9BACI|nr:MULTISPECIES: hypothetical protein [Allobacillus]MBU6081546.1 hypothetical protein [Allobacillus halotolerans]TSJ69433.1 hypothetical protein FPQ10_03035 [Allobacillus sp. SKP2-8]
MIARILTFLLIGGLLLAAIAVAAPQYLTEFWIVLALLFLIGISTLVIIYLRRAISLIKEMNAKE